MGLTGSALSQEVQIQEDPLVQLLPYPKGVPVTTTTPTAHGSHHFSATTSLSAGEGWTMLQDMLLFVPCHFTSP